MSNFPRRPTSPPPGKRREPDEEKRLVDKVRELRGLDIPWRGVEAIVGLSYKTIITIVRRFEFEEEQARRAKPEARNVRCLGPLHRDEAVMFLSRDPSRQRMCPKCRRALREGFDPEGPLTEHALAGVRLRGA